jgi:PLP dependent protein
MPFADNLARIQEEIAMACRRAGRDPSDVALMAVSKMHPAGAIREAYHAGVRLFGENRVQEWQQKRAELGEMPDVEMHLIGPLQSNKTNNAAEIFDRVDTVDSVKIAARLDAAARAMGKKLAVSVEVKLSHEESKHGIAPDDLPALLEAMRSMEALVPCGLMTVPPWSEDGEAARPYFRELRRLRDASLPACPTLIGLSMGMSNDFSVAIEEGSTCVRIGTALFGSRRYAESVSST